MEFVPPLLLAGTRKRKLELPERFDLRHVLVDGAIEFDQQPILPVFLVDDHHLVMIRSELPLAETAVVLVVVDINQFVP